MLNLVSKFEFDRYMVIGENMAALTTQSKSIFWNTLGFGEISHVLFPLSGHASTVAYYIVILTASCFLFKVQTSTRKYQKSRSQFLANPIFQTTRLIITCLVSVT